MPRTFVLSNAVFGCETKKKQEEMNGIDVLQSNAHQFHSFLLSPLKTRQVDLSGFIYVCAIVNVYVYIYVQMMVSK